MDDPYYTTFNRLTGINNLHRITGYEGSGEKNDPSRGYKIHPPYAGLNYRKIEYPDAVQTFATSLNNRKMVAGFYQGRTGKIRGFVAWKNIWSSYEDPLARRNGATELLGLNDADEAVGIARVGSVVHAFQIEIGTDHYVPIVPPGGTNAAATGIDGHGDIVGYLTLSSGVVAGFLLKNGKYQILSYPGATATEFLGITIYDAIVGSFVGAGGVTHGFLLQHPSSPARITWQQIDVPNVNATIVTSINKHGEIVGWYVGDAGKNHGFMGTPR
ncbi:MAG: hypothetical protein WA431_17520 [Candidatus Cybelea sp.]